MWLSGLGIVPQTKRSPVQFQVRAHAWVEGQTPSWRYAGGNRSMFLLHMDVPLPLFLPPTDLSSNKGRSHVCRSVLPTRAPALPDSSRQAAHADRARALPTCMITNSIG